MTTLPREDAPDLAVPGLTGCGLADLGFVLGFIGRRLRTWSRRRVLVFVFTGCGLVMLPWLAVLGFALPGTAVAAHWNLAWTGLDTIEAVGLLATGILLARGDRRYAVTATVTGTALLIDAWFDMLTATSPGGLLTAVAMAGLTELPLAGLCLLVAVRAVPARRRPGPRSPTTPAWPARPGRTPP